MQRGEVWWVNFEPSVSGEMRKQRPAIIVSNNLANRFLNRVQVIPLTTNIEKMYPGEAAVTINGTPSKALADQLTTVSKTRLSNKMGQISKQDMVQVAHAIKLQLDLLD